MQWRRVISVALIPAWNRTINGTDCHGRLVYAKDPTPRIICRNTEVVFRPQLVSKIIVYAHRLVSQRLVQFFAKKLILLTQRTNDKHALPCLWYAAVCSIEDSLRQPIPGVLEIEDDFLERLRPPDVGDILHHKIPWTDGGNDLRVMHGQDRPSETLVLVSSRREVLAWRSTHNQFRLELRYLCNRFVDIREVLPKYRMLKIGSIHTHRGFPKLKACLHVVPGFLEAERHPAASAEQIDATQFRSCGVFSLTLLF